MWMWDMDSEDERREAQSIWDVLLCRQDKITNKSVLLELGKEIRMMNKINTERPVYMTWNKNESICKYIIISINKFGYKL